MKIQLYGNADADDTAAIQAMLDTGKSCVYLPPPEKHYRISRPLVIGSGQELRLDRFTVIRLAPHSDCVMLTNRDKHDGNSRIAVTGGIWDFDNLNQGPNFMLLHLVTGQPYRPPTAEERKYRPDRYRGVAMYFENVSGMVVRGVTVRNPVTYAIQFCRSSYFLIDDIEFDFTSWNPAPANMDGVHLDGGCHHGKISNLRGCCYDDLVALNANDGRCAAYEGPITDIDIDGVYAEYCHSAVRMLSTGAELKRISVRNIHGSFYRYTVGLTHFFADRDSRGVFDDIVIAECFAAQARQPKELTWKLEPFPVIFCDEKTDIGKLSIRNLCRDEKTQGAPSVQVGKGCRVETLSIRDSGTVNRLPEPIEFVRNDGSIGRLTLENIRRESAPGAGEVVLLAGNGTVEHKEIR